MRVLLLCVAAALVAYGFVYLPAIPIRERRNDGVIPVNWYPVREFPELKKRKRR